MILNWIGRRTGVRGKVSWAIIVTALAVTTATWPSAMRARTVEADVKILLIGNQLLDDVRLQVLHVIESSSESSSERTAYVQLRGPSN